MDWQPIETAPKDGTWVLVWEPYINTKYPKVEITRWLMNALRSMDGMAVTATHWMPLPAPPVARGGDQ